MKLGRFERWKLTLLLAAVLSGGLGVPAAIGQTGVPVDLLAPADEIIEDAMQRYHLPGGALAIVKDGHLVLARGYGLADVEANEPVRPTSVFRLASVTKTITAAAIMRLYEQGALDLDARVFGLIDLEPYNGAWGDPRLCQITIRHLLQHSGGWDREITYDPIVYPILRRASDATGGAYPLSREDLIRYMLAQPLQFAPGERYAYSNFGYVILGKVIEKVSGRSLEDFVRQEFLNPLGIRRFGLTTGGLSERLHGDVRYYDDPGAALEQSTYTRDACLVPRQYSYLYWDSEGGAEMSVIDLAYLVSSMRGAVQPEILSQASWLAMQSPAPYSIGATS